VAGGRPFQPGHPRYGGRKPGSKDKLVAAREEACLRTGQSPIAFLTEVFRNPTEPTSVRVSAAQTLCQYIYPKLSSVDVNGRDGQPLVVQVLRFSDLPDEREQPPAGPIIEIAATAGDSVVIDVVAAPVAAALDDKDATDDC
jgi:hypothetical protein